MASAKKKTAPVKKTSAKKKMATKKAPAKKRATLKQAVDTPPTKSQLRVKVTEAPMIVRSVRPAPTSEEISTRANQLWVRRGCLDGFAREDWLIAEAELYNGL
jgi:Protein of unknown function (DUF2934)